MQRFLAKKLIQKKQPTLVYTCGTWGKSMFAHAASYLLHKMGVPVYYDNSVRSLSLSALEGMNTFTAALRVLVGVGKSEGIHLLEFHEDSRIEREVLDLYPRSYLVIPFISDEDIESAGSLEKYLLRSCYLTKKRAKEITVIFNSDVAGLQEVLEEMGVETMRSFSVGVDSANLQALSVEFKLPDDAAIANDYRVQGMLFKARNGGSTLPLRLNGGAGEPHVYAILAVMELMHALDINLVDSLGLIRDLPLLPGRLRLIPGIKRTLLLDDTYDMDFASASTTIAIGSALPVQEGHRKILALGDLMHEGGESEADHAKLGELIAGLDYEAVIGIGERVNDTLIAAQKAGFDENLLFHFTDQIEAGKFIQGELKQGDLVVVVGSKEQKLESVIKELMAFPLQAKDVLLNR